MSGNYEILGAVGHGGMANVYQARDLDLDRDVAIKELSEQLSESERFVHLFLSEARKMASISHPNVLPIHSIDDGHPCPRLVMELAESSLADQIGEQACEPVFVERVGRQILQGLEAIHAAGLVHRDIKPANIFYSRGFYKIGDFGIATDGEEHTQLLATPRYLAPEVLNRPHLVGPASDLYSLGLILYEALVGSSRFEEAVARVVDAETAAVGGGAPQAQRKHLWRAFHGGAGELPPPHELNSEISEALSRWVAKLTAKDVAKRFQTCREALTTLDRGGTAEITPGQFGPGVTQPIDPAARKKSLGPLQIVLIAGILLISILGGWLAWKRYSRADVEIVSRPPGAMVYFEGEKLERTPYKESVRFGATIELRLDGFKTYKATFERGNEELGGELTWVPVTITSEPVGAGVVVDGETVGATPLQLVRTGVSEAEIRLELEGHVSRNEIVQAGSGPLHLVLEPRPPELPGPEAAASPTALAAALERWVSTNPTSRIALASGDGSRVRFGEIMRWRVRVTRPAHAALFLLLSNGDVALLYPSPPVGGLQLGPDREIELPLAEHASAGYRLEASEPAGRDLAFLLTSNEPLPPPPAGEPLGRWSIYYPWTAGDAASPALALVRWAAELRRDDETSELVRDELVVEPGR